eukprot:3445911-Amphidinium_carterae.1
MAQTFKELYLDGSDKLKKVVEIQLREGSTVRASICCVLFREGSEIQKLKRYSIASRRPSGHAHLGVHDQHTPGRPCTHSWRGASTLSSHL